MMHKAETYQIKIVLKETRPGISDLLEEEKEKIIYEYDFGDGWKHELKLEKILHVAPERQLPVCTGGKRNCPPEDCGGVWGYAAMLEILADPGHEGYGRLMEWLEEDYDPDHFDPEEVNRLLKEDNYGCFGWF